MEEYEVEYEYVTEVEEPGKSGYEHLLRLFYDIENTDLQMFILENVGYLPRLEDFRCARAVVQGDTKTALQNIPESFLEKQKIVRLCCIYNNLEIIEAIEGVKYTRIHLFHAARNNYTDIVEHILQQGNITEFETASVANESDITGEMEERLLNYRNDQAVCVIL